MTKYILLLLATVLPLVSSAGTATKIPAVGAVSAPIIAYDYFEFHIVGAQQSDHDQTTPPTGPNCIPITRYTQTSAGVLGVSYTTAMATASDCSAGEDLRSHSADTLGSARWFDYWKPPGIKWTVTRFDCAFIQPNPGSIALSGTREAEKLYFNIGYRTSDSATTVSEELVTIDSDEDAGVWVSNTSIEEVIGETEEATSLVMMFQVDDDGMDTGAVSYLNINVKCIVTVKVES